MSSGKMNSSNHIRPDLKVGQLARLAFATYFQLDSRNPAEIIRLQNGEYCRNTFRVNSTMPVLLPIAVIDGAPNGFRVGEKGFLNARYGKTVYEIDGVRYRITNDWHEPPNPRDNRTPLEDWIRRIGLAL